MLSGRNCARFQERRAVARRERRGCFYKLSWLFPFRRNLFSLTFLCEARAQASLVTRDQIKRNVHKTTVSPQVALGKANRVQRRMCTHEGLETWCFFVLSALDLDWDHLVLALNDEIDRPQDKQYLSRVNLAVFSCFFSVAAFMIAHFCHEAKRPLHVFDKNLRRLCTFLTLLDMSPLDMSPME